MLAPQELGEGPGMPHQKQRTLSQLSRVSRFPVVSPVVLGFYSSRRLCQATQKELVFPLCLEASSDLRPSQKRDIREAMSPREPWKAVAVVGFMNTSLKDKLPL